MFILVRDGCTGASGWCVTLHANREGAEKKIQEYARTGWVEMYGEEGGWHGEKDVNGYPTTIADCIEWLAGGCEYMHLFRAYLGGGLGEEVVLQPSAYDLRRAIEEAAAQRAEETAA
jgi:hypothetical protein